MGDTDRASRLLADLVAPQILPRLLRGRRVEVLADEPTELKFIDRRSDCVVRCRLDGAETIVHMEFQTRHERSVPLRVLEYHGKLRARYPDLPVISLVVYLMPDPPATPPRGVQRTPQSWQLDFAYEVFCPWETPITLEEVRSAPGLAPLASLTPGIDQRELPALREAIEGGTPAAKRGDLLAITYVIAGRRWPSHLLASILRSKEMEESSTYRELIETGRKLGWEEGREEGREEGLRRAILDLVQARLGSTPDTLPPRLASLDAEEMHALFVRLLHARDDAAFGGLLGPVR